MERAGADQGASRVQKCQVDGEAGPVSRTVTRDRSFFHARTDDSFEIDVVSGRWTVTRPSHGPRPPPPSSPRSSAPTVEHAGCAADPDGEEAAGRMAAAWCGL